MRSGDRRLRFAKANRVCAIAACKVKGKTNLSSVHARDLFETVGDRAIAKKQQQNNQRISPWDIP